jgi:DNA-binding Lrp family transcriptional regulator
VYRYSFWFEKYLNNFLLNERIFSQLKIHAIQVVEKLKMNPDKTLDDTDLHIIALLQEDSRLSFNKIATKLGVSVGTAYNHVKNLEALGVIKEYTAILDPVKLGYEFTAIILVQASGKHLAEVETEIAKARSVVAVYDITGDYDAAVVAKFKDRASLNDFVKTLLATSNIKRTVTNVVLNVIKEGCLSKISDL